MTTNGKDSTLCQYKGYGDRPVTPEEDAFLTAWCKEKHIIKSERDKSHYSHLIKASY